MPRGRGYAPRSRAANSTPVGGRELSDAGDDRHDLGSDATSVQGSSDRADEWVELTAIYIGGPDDGQTEEISAGPDPGDAPGVVRVFGFELWPNGHPSRPTGRYEPDGLDDRGWARFVWQAYSPEEQLQRQRDAERTGMVIQGDALSRIIHKLFWGTRVIDWNVRRVMRQQRRDASRREEED